MTKSLLKLFIFIQVILYVKSNAPTYEDDDEEEEEVEFRHAPKHIKEWNCVKPHLFYSVGENIENKTHFMQVREEHDYVLAVLDSSECYSCCKYEVFYHNLQEKFLKKNKYLKAKLNVHLVRIDIQGQFWVLPHYVSDRVPFLALYEKGYEEPHKYYQYMDYKRIMRWISNIYKPIKKLKNAKQVEKFMQREARDLDKQIIRTVKVLGLFFDKDEMVEEIEEFYKAANALKAQGEIEFAIMTDPAEIKLLHKTYEKDWFELYSLSTVCIKKKPGYYNVIDLSDQQEILSKAIEVNALSLFGEITERSFKIYHESGLPNVVVLMDTIHQYQTMKDVSRLFEKVAAFFIDQVNFMWGDGIFNDERKKQLGIKHKKLPAIAFNFGRKKKLVYPDDWNITAAKLKYFVEDYLTHKYDYGYLQSKYDKEFVKQQRSKIYKYFQNIEEINADNFTQVVMDSKQDCVVFYFHSRSHKSFVKKVAHRLNHMARRFQEIYITKVKFYYFDSFYSKHPLEIKNVDKNGAIFLYQNGKKEHPRTYPDIGKMSLIRLTNFIKEHTTYNINLPVDAHIPEDQLEEYYEDKAAGIDIFEDDYLYKVDL